MTIQPTDTEILNRLHACVQNERKITLQVIELLKEVDRRKLYLTLGFGSLIEFCIQELKYSESAAWRRISAMRAVRDLPELEEKIEAVSKSEKRDLFHSLEGLSSRETEKVLLSRDPEMIGTEKLRQISSEFQELKIILTPEMQKDLEKLKSLVSHILPDATLTDVLQVALKDSLKKRDLESQLVGKQKIVRPPKVQTSVPVSQSKIELPQSQFEIQSRTPTSVLQSKIEQPQSQSGIQSSTPASVLQGKIALPPSQARKAFPISVKRLVWKRSQGQCCFQHQGRRCSSRFQLEIDHVISLAKGGAHSIENLQLLCRQHNQQKGFA